MNKEAWKEPRGWSTGYLREACITQTLQMTAWRDVGSAHQDSRVLRGTSASMKNLFLIATDTGDVAQAGLQLPVQLRLALSQSYPPISASQVLKFQAQITTPCHTFASEYQLTLRLQTKIKQCMSWGLRISLWTGSGLICHPWIWFSR